MEDESSLVAGVTLIAALRSCQIRRLHSTLVAHASCIFEIFHGSFVQSSNWHYTLESLMNRVYMPCFVNSMQDKRVLSLIFRMNELTYVKGLLQDRITVVTARLK